MISSILRGELIQPKSELFIGSHIMKKVFKETHLGSASIPSWSYLGKKPEGVLNNSRSRQLTSF